MMQQSESPEANACQDFAGTYQKELSFVSHRTCDIYTREVKGGIYARQGQVCTPCSSDFARKSAIILVGYRPGGLSAAITFAV